MIFGILCIFHLSPAGVEALGNAEAGKIIYERLCVGCHGIDGRGSGRLSPELVVRPRNLADPRSGAHRSDQQLFDIIQQGGTVLGLSPLMKAFGNQLAPQEIWNVVAYVRTLSVEASQPERLSESAEASQQTRSTALVMQQFHVSIWPQYDDPRVLIMLRGEMVPQHTFPTRIAIPIPKDVEIIGAGMISEQDEMLLHPYHIISGPSADSLELHLPVPRFFVEFYYNPFVIRGLEKRFTYAVNVAYPTTLLTIDIQQPLRVENFVIDPQPTGQVSQQGFIHHQFAYRDLSEGQTQTFNISYTATSTAPSISQRQSAPTQQRESLATPGKPVAQNIIVPSLVMLACVTGIFVGSVWWWKLSRYHEDQAVLKALSTAEPFSLPQEIPGGSQDAQANAISLAISTLSTRPNFCVHCGYKLRHSDRFCPQCGKRIDQIDTSTVQ